MNGIQQYDDYDDQMNKWDVLEHEPIIQFSERSSEVNWNLAINHGVRSIMIYILLGDCNSLNWKDA